MVEGSLLSFTIFAGVALSPRLREGLYHTSLGSHDPAIPYLI